MRRYVCCILAIALALPLMFAFTVPTGSVASAPSKWLTGGNAEILSETNETWVTETLVVDLKSITGYVQLDQILTDLIGENGTDGEGYISIKPTDYLKDFSFLQLVGDPAATDINPAGDTKAATWYLRSNEDQAHSHIFKRGVNTFVQFGAYADYAATGYVFAFSTTANGNIAIRGIGEGTGSGADSYADTANIASAKKLSEIAGANGTTGEDGVYFRLQSFGDPGCNFKYTVKVVFPMPKTNTLSSGKTSHWTVGGGAEIVSESTEAVAIDTATVDLKDINGHITLNEKLTNLIGEDGEDGFGYVNVICDNYLDDYSFLQLVGNPNATGIDPVRDTKALTWYLRTDGVSNSLVYLRGEGNPVKIYGIQSQFAGEGYKFAFTKNNTGNVMIRGIGDHVWETFDTYEDTAANLTSRLKLSEIVGDAAGLTGEDGVYFRLQSFGDPGCNFKYTVSVKHLVEFKAPAAGTTPEATPTATPTPIPEGVNLVPEDLFASKDKANQWFGGAMSDDASHYTEENGDYVYYAPVKSNWPYTNQKFPGEEFTVKFNIKPTVYTNSSNATAYGGMGILLGFNQGNNSGFPWMNIRFDANYDTKKMTFYVWEHTGSTSINPSFGTDWYEGEFPEDLWFEVIMEFTKDGTKIYLDGYQAPALDTGRTPPSNSLGHFPQSDELTYIGLFPSGTGHYIKNFEVYKGVDLQLGALAPSATPSETPSATPTVTPGQTPNQPTGDSSVMILVALVTVCAGAAIVFLKKRSCKA